MHNLAIKNHAIELYERGMTISEISRMTGIKNSTVRDWIHFNDIRINKDILLERENEILKKKIKIYNEAFLQLNLSKNDKNLLIDKLKEILGINCYELCDLFNHSRGTYHYHIKEEKTIRSYEIRDDLIKEKIKEIYDRCHGIFGKRKIQYILNRDYSIKTTTEKIRILMNDMGLKTVVKRKRRIRNKDIKAKSFSELDLLQRNFNASKPNEKWVSDFTNISSCKKRYHILIILDLYSRKIVGYQIAENQNAEILCSCFKKTFKNRGCPKELIFHSDNGKEYTSTKFINLLKRSNVKQSFSRKGTPLDNAVIEALNKTIKRELTNGESYKDIDDLSKDIAWYIDLYNDYRPHTYNGYKTPNEKEEK